ncbi:MAG: hypothetical protein J7M25_04965 [Deltaproteobacteria bacterium]|nr:hypothetical protein [Deltaproteobacteria bacterium]
MSKFERQMDLFPNQTSAGVRVRTIMNASHVPSMDWTINPYVGCTFGCTYCYAQFFGRHEDRKIGEWGSFVFPKENFERILARELMCLSRRGGRVLFSSVTAFVDH